MSGIYRWFAAHPVTGRVIGGEIRSVAPFHKAPERFHDWDCFVSVNPADPCPRIKARDTDVSVISQVLIDLDPIDDAPVSEEDWLAVSDSIEYALSTLLGYYPNCTANFSGRGIQVLLGISEWPITNNILRQEWRSTTKRFLIELSEAWSKNPFGLRVDTCTSDLSRLCRAVGTINQTTNLMSRHIMSNDGALVDPRHFISRFPVQKFLESALPMAHPKSWWVKFPRLTVAARRFISEGARRGERNAEAYKAAISCLDNGISIVDTMAALQKGNKLSSPPMDESELRTVLQNALRRQSVEDATY